MTTKQVAAIIISTVVLTFGGFYGIMQIDHNQRLERKASDQCWIKGGEYRDGTCEMPKKAELQQKAEDSCGHRQYIISDADIYCVDDKHGVFKVGQ